MGIVWSRVLFDFFYLNRHYLTIVKLLIVLSEWICVLRYRKRVRINRVACCSSNRILCLDASCLEFFQILMLVKPFIRLCEDLLPAMEERLFNYYFTLLRGSMGTCRGWWLWESRTQIRIWCNYSSFFDLLCRQFIKTSVLKCLG